MSLPMDALNRPLKLPCGAMLPNRLAKSAMTEGLADEYNRATERHVRLYTEWSSGCGLLVTGNIQIDRRYMERPGNVAIDGKQDELALNGLRKFAAAATQHGNHCWAQIAHAGRQSHKTVSIQGVAPSAIGFESPGAALGPLDPIGKPAVPRALTEGEVIDIVEKFAYAAAVCKEAGFTGVQLHGAHGYLLSSFLNPRANIRNDPYGGSLANRARILLDSVKAVRTAVGPDFPVSVKLNSSDFQQGGFTTEDAAGVAGMLDALGLDLLEISGGNYENPAILGGPSWWQEVTGADTGETRKDVSQSTMVREAYFLSYAKDIRAAMKRTPLMVTGGMRSADVMAAALLADCDVIGVGRPLCGGPHCVDDLLSGRISALPRYENTLQLPRLLRFLSRFAVGRIALVGGVQQWYYRQLLFLGDTGSVADNLSPLAQLGWMESYEHRTAASLKGPQVAACVGTALNPPPKSLMTKMRLPLAAAAVALLAMKLLTMKSQRARL